MTFQSLIAQRLYSRSFALIIPTSIDDDEFQHLLEQSIAIDAVKKDLLKGDISTEDYLDAVEFFGVDIDSYCKQAEQNLNNNLNELRRRIR